MDFKKFNEIAELVGIAAVVASLLFVGLQLRQSQLIALAEVDGSIIAGSIEMASLISDNSEVWSRGAMDEELRASEMAVFESIVVALAAQSYHMAYQYRLLGDDDTADSVVHEFAAYLHARPGARRVWIEREAELRRIRGILEPESLETYSTYFETIKTDLAVLDRHED